MTTPNWCDRTIFTGDNLYVMRGMNSESVDLIYLDPPFNSNRAYAAPIGSESAGAAFKDTWTLQDVDWVELNRLKQEHGEGLYRFIEASLHTHSKGMFSYLVMMAIRLIEMKRILKPTGSIYLHCDPTASHYLKGVMDSIFGSSKFRNEICWERLKGAGKTTQHKPRTYGPTTDVLLFYTASDDYLFEIDRDLVPFSTDYLKTFKFSDAKGPYGRRSPFNSPGQGARPNQCYEYKGFFPPHDSGWNVTLPTLEKMDREGDLEFVNNRGIDRVYRKIRPKEGKWANTLWGDIQPALGKEREGYPTQKPLALLKRIIEISSNEGDVVFDPFCGCATTLVMAEKLQRNWIGADISPKAAELVHSRIRKEQGLWQEIVSRDDIPRRTDMGEELTPSKKAEYKKVLYGMQEGNCNGCYTHFERVVDFEMDHITPQALGGTDHKENFQLLCPNCNKRKGKRRQEEFMADMAKERKEFSLGNLF